MKGKKFDCVEMKRGAQEKIYREIKNMSVAEELAYWKGQEQVFRQEIAQAKRMARPARKSKAVHA